MSAGLFCKLLCIALVLVAARTLSNPFSPWNEEATDSLGPCVTIQSVKHAHSTFHYDLTLLLAVKAGFSSADAETIARYCALTDQINPQVNYPYPNALNNISIPDTIPGWDESLAGTERGNLGYQNIFNEYPAQYWHFPLRDSTDTISGAMVYGEYPEAGDFSYRSQPYFWRVPLVVYLQNIMRWAIYGEGDPGLPDPATPVEAMYFDASVQQYQPVQPGSIQALGIYLHVLADSYSHEHCCVEDTLRSHPPTHDYCGLNYHSMYEYAYDTAIIAGPQAEYSAHAIWRALREYKRINAIGTPLHWITDDNGFQDGDGIPDELEDNLNENYQESFIERWKTPALTDLNGDGKINHSDHTTSRILACNGALTGFSFSPENGQSIMIRPNPAQTLITVEFGSPVPEATTITVYDLRGKELIQKPVPAGIRQVIIDISRLPAGAYLLKGGNGESIIYRNGKIVKW